MVRRTEDAQLEYTKKMGDLGVITKGQFSGDKKTGGHGFINRNRLTPRLLGDFSKKTKRISICLENLNRSLSMALLL